jgi:hypothetical protein
MGHYTNPQPCVQFQRPFFLRSHRLEVFEEEPLRQRARDRAIYRHDRSTEAGMLDHHRNLKRRSNRV